MLESGVLARCPSCRNTFSTERTGRQQCPVCGKELIVPEVPPASAPRPDAPASGTPWERRAELGFFRAWLKTIQLVLFEPGALFRAAHSERTRDALWFAVFTGSLFTIVNQLLQWATFGQTQKMMRDVLQRGGGDANAVLEKWLDRQQHLLTPSFFVLAIIAAPAITFLFLYLNAGVTHVFAMLFGQNRRGFPATFTACSYAMATTVLFALPGCGSIIGIVWMVVVIGIGLKELHGISAAGATSSVLAPYVAMCCSTMILAVFVGMMIARLQPQ